MGINISVSPPNNQSMANFKIRLLSSSVLGPRATRNNSPSSVVDTSAVSVDNSTAIVATGAWSNIVGTTVLSGRMTFSGAAVRDITAADFEVLDDNDAVQSTGWRISVSASSVDNGGFVDVTATPTNFTSALFKLNLKATSVKSHFSTTDNAPMSAITSNAVIVSPIRWSNIRYADGWLQGTLNSDRNLYDVHPRGFQVLNESGVFQTGWTFESRLRFPNGNLNTSNFISSSSPSTIRIMPPVSTYGMFKIRLNRSSISLTRNSYDIPQDNIDSIAVLVNRSSLIWGTITGGIQQTPTLSGNITFNGTNVTNIEITDFKVLNTNNQVQTGWTITINPSIGTANDGDSITVTATPPLPTLGDITTYTHGSFKLRLEANSIRSGGSTLDNFPSSHADSTNVPLDNRPQYAVTSASWSNINGGRVVLSGRITFTSDEISNIETTNFEVLNSSNKVQTGWPIVISGTTIDDNNSIMVTATAPSNTNGSFKLRLKSLSIRSGGSTYENSPTNAITSCFGIGQ